MPRSWGSLEASWQAVHFASPLSTRSFASAATAGPARRHIAAIANDSSAPLGKCLNMVSTLCGFGLARQDPLPPVACDERVTISPVIARLEAGSEFDFDQVGTKLSETIFCGLRASHNRRGCRRAGCSSGCVT